MGKEETIEHLFLEAVEVLKQLVRTPSLSREEDKTGDILQSFFESRHIPVQRIKNNVIARSKHFDPSKKTLLLNSHHDTVPPNRNYTLDPFSPVIREEKLFGLGANDAGAPLVSMIATFLYFFEKDATVNIVFAASAEEEISGKNGVELLLPSLPKIDMAIVGEPTLMNMAIAEKGLLVLDCIAHGKSGHAARDEGENAIYKAVRDIEWIQKFNFQKESEWLHRVHTAVTSIETDNKAHNVVPGSCRFVVDVRVNELYTCDEVVEIFRKNLSSEVNPRSLRLKPSFISADHALVKAGKKLGMEMYGSPTCSDMALIPFPAVKCGPGDSARSHTADEFIYLHEIKNGITKYVNWIEWLGKED